MTLQTLSEWLRCPKCFSPLEAVGALELGCANGHRYDANKRGFVTLLDPTSGLIGDDAPMLDARAHLLGSGAYDPLVKAIVEHAQAAGDIDRVLDAGCGTGYYLGRLLQSAGREARGLAMDLSPAAVRQAVRHVGRDRADGLVADTWQPIPVRNASADVLLNVFAPRNRAEFARVLRPGGVLVVAVPRADHLIELRAATDMLDVPEGKAQQLLEQLEGDFRPVAHSTVHYTLEPTHELAVALRQMGPSARHQPREGSVLPASVTVAVDVLSFLPAAVGTHETARQP